MTSENQKSPTLWVLLSALGVLAAALTAGLFLFQPLSADPLRPSLAIGRPATEDLGFDPIAWAREDAEFPPLDEGETPPEAFVVEIDPNGEVEATTPADAVEAVETVVETVPVSVETAPPEPVKPAVREVRENAYWVQVGSWSSSAKAETVRNDLTDRGLPAAVQVREVNGETRYRVRIGAFDYNDEAESYAVRVRALPDYSGSFVVQAPVTRRIPAGG